MIFGVGVVPSTHGTPAIKEAPVHQLRGFFFG
jgi:hypothetical protein